VGYGDNGKDQFSLEDIQRAVAIAQSQDFVECMEGGYDAHIAQGGANLSGGQKQRLAIARAVCRKPEIYIFDDSFSALDYKTDRVLRNMLKKETAGVTTMIVSQRIGTIMDADQIIVLDEGKVVGRGKHKDLLKNCEVYRQIALSQLSEEELAS
jgi:ATP-binding cassette subfamily B protein